MKYQKLYNIVLSDKRSIRWERHFLFWLAVFLYHVVRIGMMMPAINSTSAIRALLNYSFTWGVLPNMFISYSVAYYLIPKYFNRQRYIAFALSIMLVIFILIANTVFRNYFDLNPRVRSAIGLSGGFTFIYNFKPGIIRVFGNPPLICCLFLSIKILKNWHLEQVKSETLARENANAELQLLKAQVHPHFLFNTLNNIYSFSLNQSPQAGALVKKLSGMLNYMIHECEKPLVPLEKEIKLIRDYIGLEKVRYGNRLDMYVELNGEYDNKMIAPLLMIPFVENCFKHGASVMRGQQWIKLVIDINENVLDFKLSNSKPSDINGANNKKGIGLTNVKKRLQLLYPGQHFLKTEVTNNSYIVHLGVNMQEFPNTEQNQNYKQIQEFQPV